VCVDEVAPRAAQLARFGVHPGCELDLGSCDVPRNGSGRIVSGTQHQAVDEVAQLDPLPREETNDARHHLQVSALDRHHFVQTPALDCENRRQDLRRAGRIHALVGVLREEGTPARLVENNRSACDDGALLTGRGGCRRAQHDGQREDRNADLRSSDRHPIPQITTAQRLGHAAPARSVSRKVRK
jgi:hypothetical protein